MDYSAIEKFMKYWGTTYIETLFSMNSIKNFDAKRNIMEKKRHKHKKTNIKESVQLGKIKRYPNQTHNLFSWPQLGYGCHTFLSEEGFEAYIRIPFYIIIITLDIYLYLLN